MRPVKKDNAFSLKESMLCINIQFYQSFQDLRTIKIWIGDIFDGGK